MMKKEDLDIKNQNYITEILPLTYCIRIATLFEYSDGSLIDIYILNDHLTDYGQTCVLFDPIYDQFFEDSKLIFERYEVHRTGYQFIKNIGLNLSEDIFRFGQFCSTISHIMFKENLHIK